MHHLFILGQQIRSETGEHQASEGLVEEEMDAAGEGRNEGRKATGGSQRQGEGRNCPSANEGWGGGASEEEKVVSVAELGKCAGSSYG